MPTMTAVVDETTEIRCQEENRGGMKYDVILSDPAATPPSKKGVSPPKTPTTAEEIEDKLRAANERRKSVEANKMAALTAQLSKIEEASKKKDELNSEFITQTKELLEQKMEHHIENREAYINDLRAKLKEHFENVEKSRATMQQQTEEIRQAIDEKLKTASNLRNENIRKIQERLEKHEEQSKKVREAMQEKLTALDNQMQIRLDQAAQRKLSLEIEMKEKIRLLNEHKAMEVKQAIQDFRKQSEERLNELNSRLALAQVNRENWLKEKKGIIKQWEKRVEAVRQNKEKFSVDPTDNEENVNTSSG